jgi:hypothetical protein
LPLENSRELRHDQTIRNEAMMANQQDLFGNSSPQGDLFGESEPARRVWKPDPDKVRARLERILAEARAAERLPWTPSQKRLFQKIFPDMTEYLPEEEAAQYRFQFETEMKRFEDAA